MNAVKIHHEWLLFRAHTKVKYRTESEIIARQCQLKATLQTKRVKLEISHFLKVELIVRLFLKLLSIWLYVNC